MTIIIKVVKFDEKAHEKVLYQNSVILNDSISFDYETIYNALRTLYPKASFISFNCSTN